MIDYLVMFIKPLFQRLCKQGIILYLLWLMPYSVLPAAEVYGPIQSGEMLWNIAAEVNPDQKFTRYQLMMALWKMNPQAFSVSCNMNSLKVGTRLTIPSYQQIEQLTATQARETFNQHYEAWRNRSRQSIECAKSESASETESNAQLFTEKNFNPVIPTLKQSISQTQQTQIRSPPLASAVDSVSETAAQSSNAAEAQQTLSPPLKTDSKQTVTSEKPNLKPQWVPPALGDDPLAVMKAFFKQLLSEHFIIAIILMSLLGLGGLALLMGLFWVLRWLFHKRASSHTPPPPEESQQTIFSKRYQDSGSSPTQSSHLNSTNDNNLKDKLAAARAGLVQEEELIQVLLREVLEQGSADQQAEAKQLIEINKKMHHLAANSSSTSTNPLQAVVQQGQQITQPIYLPDNKKQIFAMIDKIFVLLDDELKAGGQLIRAYQQRHQHEFNQTSYQDDTQTEKILVEKSGNNWANTDEKSTRYL